jgi:hypothetical protein
VLVVPDQRPVVTGIGGIVVRRWSARARGVLAFGSPAVQGVPDRLVAWVKELRGEGQPNVLRICRAVPAVALFMTQPSVVS